MSGGIRAGCCCRAAKGLTLYERCLPLVERRGHRSMRPISRTLRDAPAGGEGLRTWCCVQSSRTPIR